MDFGEELELSSIELVLNTNPLDYPRNFTLEASIDRSAWTPLASASGFFPPLDRGMIEDFSKYSVPVPFERIRARFFRFTISAGLEARHWSINEIILR